MVHAAVVILYEVQVHGETAEEDDDDTSEEETLEVEVF